MKSISRFIDPFNINIRCKNDSAKIRSIKKYNKIPILKYKLIKYIDKLK